MVQALEEDGRKHAAKFFDRILLKFQILQISLSLIIIIGGKICG
jgi:hypothetical protein